MRSQQTEVEQPPWYHPRSHGFMGSEFTRQKPVGRYIPDFICYEPRRR